MNTSRWPSIIAGVVVVATAIQFLLYFFEPLGLLKLPGYPHLVIIGPPHRPPRIPEIVKKDCQKLVDGQLLFEPSRTMRQGQPYLLLARLIRNPGINITE